MSVIKFMKSLRHPKSIFIWLFLAMWMFSCPEDPCDGCVEDIIPGEYDPTAYDFQFPEWLPEFEIPEGNPMTVEGIALGRKLFYETDLSGNRDLSCASCHQLEFSFSDNIPFSLAGNGQMTSRAAMALVNLGFNETNLLWDGRAQTLEEQVLQAVEDPLMLDGNWVTILDRLTVEEEYQQMFRAAFGVEKKSEITKEHVAKAIAQFERTLVSYNSRYDQVVWENDGWFSNEEERGRSLFFKEDDQQVEHPGCSHCHIAKYFTDHSFRNNGIDGPPSLSDFEDLGRGGVTGVYFDNGKFRVPTLRNIEMTAPYMHDGRFETLEEVLDHYSEGGHDLENEDPNIRPFTLSETQKQDMISFLKTLTDTVFLNNPDFKNPF